VVLTLQYSIFTTEQITKMAERQTYIEQNTLPAQRITLSQRSAQITMAVSAALPDNFGMTVGSEFASPFDTGNINQTLSKALFLANIPQKASLRMRKLYSNPTPTEISFDMEFTSFYDAKYEVVYQALKLMAMSVGRQLTWEDMVERISKMANAGQELAQSGLEAFGLDTDIRDLRDSAPEVDASNQVSKVTELFSLLQGPPTVIARFGETFTIQECFVTSVASKFSNVLDINGYPTSAVCSVTLTPQTPPVMEDIERYFNKEIVRNSSRR
jgi:hypothetical protein